MSLFDLRSVDLNRPKPKYDDLLICGGCGNISKVTLTDTVLLTDEEFKALHPDEQADLDFAQRAIKRNLRQN